MVTKYHWRVYALAIELQLTSIEKVSKILGVTTDYVRKIINGTRLAKTKRLELNNHLADNIDRAISMIKSSPYYDQSKEPIEI